MRFTISNLGPIKSAEISPGELTVICGKNNTGKTYISYTLFGILDYIKTCVPFPIENTLVEELINYGVINIPISLSKDSVDNFLKNCLFSHRNLLPVLFSAQPSHFRNSNIDIALSKEDFSLPITVNASFRIGKNLTLNFNKEKTDSFIRATLFIEEDFKNKNPQVKQLLTRVIGDFLKKIFFAKAFPEITFASAERTGVLMFRDELTPDRGKDINEVFNTEYDDLDIALEDITRNMYPLPVVSNISFMKSLRNISQKTSSLSKKFPDLIGIFKSIVGGGFSVDETGVYYLPKENAKIKLAMEESSSSVRSLVLLSFWIHHIAKKGEMIMIDEPEMNLHPSSQRILARWIVMLVNAGIRVMVTTHSDYFIKELNILIMLNARKRHSYIKDLMKEENILSSMLLSPQKLKVYIATRETKVTKDGNNILSQTTIAEAPIDNDYGVSVSSFDDTIREMNKIQEAILFNG